MLWSKRKSFDEEPFDNEKQLEDSIREVSDVLFGESRIYLDAKRKIGSKGKTRNIPDGYLIDLASTREPKLYVVENELAAHEPLKHVAVQILEFSLSFETSPHTVKSIVRDAIVSTRAAAAKCKEYARENGFENLDMLLERMIYGEGSFNALVIIDELSEELEKALISRFQFPVETLTLQRYRGSKGQRLYRFVPFLSDISSEATKDKRRRLLRLDPSEIDTIVVPAREEGFRETFLGQRRWYAIRIHPSMVPKIKYIAAYRVAPTSAITHIAPVESIKQWRDTSKYVVNFSSPAKKMKPLALVANGNVKAPQAPRYTSKSQLESAKNLDGAF